MQQHCQLCKPLKPLPKVKGAVDVDFAVPLYGTVLRWATQLRQESPAKGSQERLDVASRDFIGFGQNL